MTDTTPDATTADSAAPPDSPAVTRAAAQPDWPAQPDSSVGAPAAASTLPGLVTPEELASLRAAVEADLADYMRDLQRLVDIDCGSYTKIGVDEVGSWVEATMTDLGMRVERHPEERFGDTLIGDLVGSGDGPHVLLIGHMDTVFDAGTVAQRPFALDGRRATGPGISDMKSGLLAGFYALRALRTLLSGQAPGGRDGQGSQHPPGSAHPEWLPGGGITYVVNPDEEIGSPVSTPHIRDRAAHADVALVLEGARANGDIVSSRKGILDLRLRYTGRAAHAGVEPEKGRSAVLSAAHAIVALHALNGRWPGVTVNAGVVHGGTRPNVVAEEASVEVDVRAVDREALEQAEAAVRAIAAAPAIPDTSCEVETMARWWPMERSAGAIHLVHRAVDLAAGLGFELRDAATGGASDANTTSGMGVPSIDGLGPIGGNDHGPAEYIELDSIVPRVTLLAALMLALLRDPEVARWREERRGEREAQAVTAA